MQPLLSSAITQTDSEAKEPGLSGPEHAARRRHRKIFAAAGAGVLQRAVQVGSTLVLMPILLRALGATQFGIWGAVASLAWLTGFLDVGTGAALVTLVARSMAANKMEEARRQIAGALGLGCVIAGGLGLLVGGAVGAGVSTIQFGPYLIAVIGLALNVPLSIANNVWMALQKGYVSGFWELVQTILTFVGLLAAASYSRDVRVYVAAVYAGLAVANLGSLVHLLVRYPQLRPGRLLLARGCMRAVAGEGMMYFLLGLTGTLAFSLDNVLALALLGPEASARMTIALRMCVTALGVIGVASQPLWPAFSEAVASEHWDWIKRTAIRGSLVLLGMTAGGCLVLLLYGERFLVWWLRGSLTISQTLLWAVAAWAFAQALIRVPALLLNGLSEIRYQILISAAMLVLSFFLKFVLSSHLGVAGILWGTTAAVVGLSLPALVSRGFRWANRASAG